MKNKRNLLLSSVRQEIEAFPVPAVALDRSWRIRCRNKKAARIFPRLRKLDCLIREKGAERSALLVRPILGNPALLWLPPPENGFRKLVLLRLFTPAEAEMAKCLLAPENGIAGETAPEGPLELRAVLADAGATLTDSAVPGKSKLWTTPESLDLIRRICRLLHLLCGDERVRIDVKLENKRALLVFSLPEQAAITPAIVRKFLREDGAEKDDYPEATVTLGESRYELTMHRAGDRCLLTLAIPAETRLSSCFFQGRKKRSRREKTHQKAK